ncbi:MAG: TPM domain-containing protein [Polyangiaceae bacterium]|nr:TPM domain-containing protein [Polyangiaceae bacterium]
MTDQANLLAPRAKEHLERRLQRYAELTGHQFAFLSIPSLEGEDIEGYSIRVVEKWKLGDKKREDGLLLLVAAQEKKIRIEVGYGLEGAIPDAIAARIIREDITPQFREQRYQAGVFNAFENLMRAAEGEAISPSPPQKKKKKRGVGLLGLIGLSILISFFLRGGRGGGIGRGLVYGGLAGLGGRGGFGGGGFGGGGGFSGGGGGFGGGGASGGW